MWRRWLLSSTGPLFTEAAAFTQIKKERKVRLCLDLGSPVAYISKPAKNTQEEQFLFFSSSMQRPANITSTPSPRAKLTHPGQFGPLWVSASVWEAPLPESVKVLADPCAVQNVRLLQVHYLLEKQNWLLVSNTICVLCVRHSTKERLWPSGGRRHVF